MRAMPPIDSKRNAGIIGSPAFILMLVAAGALNPLAIHIILPAAPTLVSEFNTDYGAVQLILSVFLWSMALSHLVVGPLADRLGRRPVLIGGLVLYVAASIGCALAGAISHLVLFRIFLGLAGGAGMVLARTILRDVYDRDKTASMLAYVTLGFVTSSSISPLLGGLIYASFGWRADFVVLAIFGSVLAFTVWRYLPETKPAGEPQSLAEFMGSIGELIRIPAFWAFSLTTAFGTGGIFAFLGAAPYVSLNILHISPTEYGLYYFLTMSGYMTGSFLSARYIQRVGIYRMIFFTNLASVVIIAIANVVVLSGSLSALVLFGAMFAINIPGAMTVPGSTSGAISVRPNLAGAASGIQGTVQIGTGATLTFIAGVLTARYHSVVPLMIMMLLIALATLGCGLWARAARS